MYDLSGKTAIVTGAGGEHGIGRAIAVRLARDGADVVVNDVTVRPHSENREEWQGTADVVAEIEALGRRAIAVEADVTIASDVDAMVGQTIEQMGRLDILVNNAGALAGRDRMPVVDLDEAEWNRILNVNLNGTFLCSRAAARAMIKQGSGGKIINLSSVAGKKGVARYAAYCSSKFAVIGFTQSLAQELAEHRINVNAICPCLVDTERVAHMAEALKPDGISTEDYREQFIGETAAKTAFGRIARPDDVARAAAYLASSEADYLTGISLTVAGGLMMD